MNLGIRGATVTQYASRFTTILVQLGVQMVLARLLAPDQFGLLAIITVFTAFFTLFSDMGLGTAIIQFQDLEARDFGGLFVFSFLLAIGLAALFCLAAYPISWFYEEAELVPLCWFASLQLFFASLNMVPNGLMLRKRRFVAIAVRTVVCAAASGVVGIALAFLGFGCYALVASGVSSALFILIWNYLADPIKPSIHFMHPLRRVFSYSAAQLGFNVINYISRNLDNFVIGKVLGSAALGFYNRAYRLTTYPNTALSAVLNSVIQPYMRDYQDDMQRLFSYWKRITKVLSLIAAPIAAMFFCAGEEIILIVYGDQWEQAIPLFQVLAVSTYFQAINHIQGPFQQSAGRTDNLFKHGIVATCVVVICLCVGLYFGGLFGAACGVAIGYCAYTISVAYFLVHSTLGQSPTCYRMLLPEILIALVSVAVCLALDAFVPLGGFILSFVIKLLVVGVITLAGYLLTGQMKYLRDIIGK